MKETVSVVFSVAALVSFLVAFGSFLSLLPSSPLPDADWKGYHGYQKRRRCIKKVFIVSVCALAVCAGIYYFCWYYLGWYNQ